MAWKQPSTLMVLDIATIVFSLFFNLNQSYFDDHDQWYKIYTIDSELYWLVWDQVDKDTAFGIIMKIATGTLIFALFSVLYSTKICQIQPCLDDSWYKITHSRLTVGLNYSFWLCFDYLAPDWIHIGFVKFFIGCLHFLETHLVPVHWLWNLYTCSRLTVWLFWSFLIDILNSSPSSVWLFFVLCF